MGHTFSAAGDDVTIQSTSQMLINSAHITAGWFNPSALTAGRYYYGAANTGTFGMTVAPTTSELRFVQDRATTDDTYDTTGAGITTNKWWFIAHMWAGNNTQGDAAIWVGDENTRPVEMSVTETAGSGNVVTGVNHVIGNQHASASLAFEGEIDRITFIRSGSGLNAANLLFATSSATLSAETKAFALSRVLLPLWAGLSPNLMFTDPASSSIGFIHDMDLSLLRPACKRLTYGVALNVSEATINASLAASRGPRSNPKRLFLGPQLLRR